MNNIKEEFIQLEYFKESVWDKIRLLEEMRPENDDDTQVINSQISGYRAIIGELDMYIETTANNDKYYNNYEEYEGNI